MWRLDKQRFLGDIWPITHTHEVCMSDRRFACPTCLHTVTCAGEPNNPDVGDYSETVECIRCGDVWTVGDNDVVYDDNGTGRTVTHNV